MTAVNTTATTTAGGCGADSGSSTPTEDGSLSGYPDIGIYVEDWKKGLVGFPIFVIFMTFNGLAVVCDKYFEPSLEAICDNLDLGPDVAGATFMAAGGSAPELATSILGVFVSKSDIGIGTIVGSAVFNVLFVIATCAFVAPNLKVTWYPLARDCIYYCMSILSLTMVVLDQEVKWWEALILFILYWVYCGMMRYNTQIDEWAQNFVAVERTPNAVQITIMRAKRPIQMFIYPVIVVNIFATLYPGAEDNSDFKTVNHICAIVFVLEFIVKQYGFGLVNYWKNPGDAFDGVLVALIGVEYLIAEGGASNNSNNEDEGDGDGGSSKMSAFRGLKFLRFLRFLRMLRILRQIKLKPVESADASTQTGESDSDSDIDAGKATNSTGPPKPANFVPVMPVSTEPIPITVLDREREKDTNGAGVETGVVQEISAGLPGGVPDNRTAPAPDVQVKKPDPAKHEAKEKNTAGDTGGVGGEEDVTNDEAEAKGEDEESDEEDDGPFNPFEHEDPTSVQGILKCAWWFVNLPVVLMMFVTIPDCKRERFKSCWVVTFFMCIVWIAILAYVMVWMATIFGVVTSIPDAVMGLTFLAAGTSIPDALSSLAVARKGHGDMAVSSSVGSNIFDILVGLPVPWVMYGVFNEGASIAICSTSVGIMIITLFIMVALVVCFINVEKWHLTQRLGFVFLALYFGFVLLSLMLEYDVFPGL